MAARDWLLRTVRVLHVPPHALDHGRRTRSIVSGLVFGFWPWASRRRRSHTDRWVFVLPVWRALVLSERPIHETGSSSARPSCSRCSGSSTGVSRRRALRDARSGLDHCCCVSPSSAGVRKAAVRLHGTGRGSARLSGNRGVGGVSGGHPRAEQFGVIREFGPTSPYVVPHPESFVSRRMDSAVPPRRDRGGPLVPVETAYADIYVGLTVVALAAIGVAVLWLRRRRGRTRARASASSSEDGPGSPSSPAVSCSPSCRVRTSGESNPVTGRVRQRVHRGLSNDAPFRGSWSCWGCAYARPSGSTPLSTDWASAGPAVLAALAIVVPLDLWGRQHDGASRVNHP